MLFIPSGDESTSKNSVACHGILGPGLALGFIPLIYFNLFHDFCDGMIPHVIIFFVVPTDRFPLLQRFSVHIGDG